MYEYKEGEIVRSNPTLFWKVVSLVLLVVAVFSVWVAWRCSRPLECVQMYKADGVQYCVSEVINGR